MGRHITRHPRTPKISCFDRFLTPTPMRASVVVFLSTAVVAWAQRGVQQPLAFQNVYVGVLSILATFFPSILLYFLVVNLFALTGLIPSPVVLSFNGQEGLQHSLLRSKTVGRFHTFLYSHLMNISVLALWNCSQSVHQCRRSFLPMEWRRRHSSM